MSDAHADVSKHIRTYLFVFAALIVGTVLTVVVSTQHLGDTASVVVALLIATVKGSLVAAIFMHLKWERSVSIVWSLLLCAFFFCVLMLLPTLITTDYPPGVQQSSWDVLPTPAVAVEHTDGH